MLIEPTIQYQTVWKSDDCRNSDILLHHRICFIRPIQSLSYRLRFLFNLVTDHWHHFIALNSVWQKWQLWKSKWIPPESLQSIASPEMIVCIPIMQPCRIDSENLTYFRFYFQRVSFLSLIVELATTFNKTQIWPRNTLLNTLDF